MLLSSCDLTNFHIQEVSEIKCLLAVLQALTGNVAVPGLSGRFSWGATHFKRSIRNKVFLFKSKCVHPKLLKKSPLKKKKYTCPYFEWTFKQRLEEIYYDSKNFSGFAPGCRVCCLRAVSYCIFLPAAIILCYFFTIKMKLFSKNDVFGNEHLNLHMLELIHSWCQEVLSVARRGCAAGQCCLRGRQCWQERKCGQGAQGESWFTASLWQLLWKEHPLGSAQKRFHIRHLACLWQLAC